MSLMHFNQDILNRLSQESKEFQRKGSSLIGMDSRKADLIKDLKKIQSYNGPVFENFLKSTLCFQTTHDRDAYFGGKIPSRKECNTLTKFEDSSFVGWHNAILEVTDLVKKSVDEDGNVIEVEQFPQSSEILKKYIDEIIENTKFRMPKEEFGVFDALNQKKWKLTKNFKTPKVTKLAAIFQMNEATVQEQFEVLVDKMKLQDNNNWWCRNKDSYPSFFWAEALNNFEMGIDIELLLRRTLVIPSGSSM